MIGGVVGGAASSMQGPRDCSRSPLNASAQVRPPPMEVSGLEMFCRGVRAGWTVWGNQADESYAPTWDTYANHSHAAAE